MPDTMSSGGKLPVEVATGVVGNWENTYGWIPIFAALANLVLAFSAGGNNIAAPFSTPIGSGVLTLLKASIMACLIYVPGTAFASKSVVNALFSDFLREKQPSEGFLMWSMVVVLVTAAIWLTIATHLELPVSSQQSAQGALLGTLLVTEGFGYVPMWNKNENHNFDGGGLLWIFLEWTVTPSVSCLFAFLFFKLLKAFLLRRENAENRILIFLPIDFGISAGLLCLFLLFQVVGNFISIDKWVAIVSVAVASLIGAVLSLVIVGPLCKNKFNVIPNYMSDKRNRSAKCRSIEIQDKTSTVEENDTNDDDVEEMLREFMQKKVLETVNEEDERSWGSPDKVEDPRQVQSVDKYQSNTAEQPKPFKQLVQSTPNKLVQTKNFQRIEETTLIANASKYIKHVVKSIMCPVMDYDRKTLIRHALAEKYDEIEDLFSFPHLLASCIFALIQSACEIGAIVSPFGAILDVLKHRAKYSGHGEDFKSIHVSWWYRAIGGLVAAMGFFVYGWRLTKCLGGKLTYMSNSRGVASQLSTVAAVIIVSRINLPASTVHGFVGSLVGVVLADDFRNLNWKLLMKILCGWVMTIVFCCGVAYVIFSASIHSPAYVVP